jgi:hypothetical protein
MTRPLTYLGCLGIAMMIAGCGGANQTYSPSPVVSQPTQSVGDWTIVNAVNNDAKRRLTPAANVTDLGDLTTFTQAAGFNTTNFGANFGGFLAQSLDGFTGTIQLTDVPSGTPDHLVCMFSSATGGTAVNGPFAVTPTVAGAEFFVSAVIPANYAYASTTLKFEASDSTGRVKTVEIPLTVRDYSGTFAPISVIPYDFAGSGSLVITPHDFPNQLITVTFDKNIQPGDNVPAAFDNPLPSNVVVTAPASPVNTLLLSSVSVPVYFSWNNLPQGQYTVIAVLSAPLTVGGQGPSIRVPCEITMTGQST